MNFMFMNILFKIFIITTTIKSMSQNIVLNGNFNNYFRCPTSHVSYGQNVSSFLVGWFSPNSGTPDFFHRCANKTKVHVPNNFATNLEPVDGNGYIGLILRADTSTYRFTPTYTEHITGILVEPLKAEKKYKVQLYYSFSPYSGIQTHSIGIYFSAFKPYFSDIDDSYDFTPQLILHPDSILHTSQKWHKLEGIYIAHGGERYITIGNFESVAKSKIIPNRPKKITDVRFFAYYVFDNVNVSLLEEEEDTTGYNLVYRPPQKKTETDKQINSDESVFYELNKKYILHNLYFDYRQSIIRPESFTELNKIVEFLNSNPDLHIKIIGHTDNIGSARYNKHLSEERAKSVFRYLYSKGIPLHRMSYEGKGFNEPIADNETELGRQINRRVEVIFYKGND